MPYNDEQKQKEAQHRSYMRNKEDIYTRSKTRREEARESAMSSLYNKTILDERCWGLWFNDKATNAYKPCFISPKEAFELMIQNCFYCGGFATTIDRLDNNIGHTLKNCVGCCEFCNKSKIRTDPLSFILRAVYRRTFEYYGDSDIWNDNKNKPQMCHYIKKAEKQKKRFDLVKIVFDILCQSYCRYCQRKPNFVGIDKIHPSNGYTIDNCVSCCQSCNRDKWEASIEEFTLRDERITQRFLYGHFDNLPYITKNTSHKCS